MTDLLESLAAFPQERPIGLKDKSTFDFIFKGLQPEISEFTFTNLFCWRDAYSIKISRLEDSLIVSCEKDAKRLFFAPLGRNNAREAIKKILEQFPEAMFFRLPERVAGLFNQEAGFKISEDRDNFDYVYKRQDLVELKGKKFDAKRNFIKRFYQQYNPVCRIATQLDIENCIAFSNEWCDDKACDLDISLRREKQAIIEMLKNCHTLNILGAVIEIEGSIKAFSIGEVLNDTAFVVHAEKASAKFTGIYQALNNFFVSVVPEKFPLINREQDLGLENLRKAKMSYQPTSFVKKYTLSKV